MPRVVVIGGSGHIGTYLVPQLISAGFEVVSVSRGQRSPYQPHGAWKFVRTVTLDREAEECPSSDDLRHVAGLQKGGSGSYVIEIMRHAGGAASDGLRLSGA
jgi:nucleoside-diphosphate-sugar epimerase